MNEAKNSLAAQMQIAGFFKIEAVNEETGERRVLADWFPNLILDQGLNRLGLAPSVSAASHCQVGTGSTAPTVTDTQLQSFLAGTNNVQSTSESYVAGPPPYQRAVRTYRFATGAAAGNLSEVGIGWGASGTVLFSRALIKDGSGNPTTITVLSTEALDISYEIRNYPPTTDVTGSVTISGTSYSYTIRAAYITQALNWGAVWALDRGFAVSGVSSSAAYDGSIGSTSSGPSGGSSGATSYTNSSYSNNSYKRGGTITFGLNSANFAGGVKSVLTGGEYSSNFQIEFSPTINKTSTKVLTLNFEISWSRRP